MTATTSRADLDDLAGESDQVEEESAVEETPGNTRGITLSGAVGLIYVLLGFVIGSRVITDNSFLTHYATGRVIWETGAVPNTDVFSFSATGEPVTVQSWLASWLYVGLKNLFGGWSIRVFNGVMAAALVASLWRFSDGAKQLLPRVFIVGSAIVVGAGLWTPRPLLFGLLGFSMVLHALRRELPYWAMLPVMWLWVNTHGSFPIALVLIGVVGVGVLLDNLVSSERSLLSSLPSALPRHELKLFWWVAAGIGVGAINPVGVKLLTFPIELLSRGEALEDVAEWKSPTFKRPAEWGFVVLALVFVYVMTRMVKAWRVRGEEAARLNGESAVAGAFASLLPAAVFIAAAMMAYRNLPLATTVLVVSIAPWLSQTRFAVDGGARGLVPNGIRLIAIVGFAMVGSLTAMQGTLDLRKYPEAEVDWLEERELVANPEVQLIQRDTTGNYLEYRFREDANVFMDDRFDFYPLPVLRDHSTLIFGGDYADVLDRNDADVVLWNASGHFAEWLRESDEWEIAYERDELERWLIACRADSEVAARCN